MDRQPTLEGDLVSLRPLREEDFLALYVIASDPMLWEQHPSKDRTEEVVFRHLFAESLASEGALAILDRRDGRVIGTSRFDRYDPKQRQVEIGWTFIARSHWGGGYNGEVKHLMLQHASRFVDYVVFRIHSLNFRSQRAVEKLGAVRVGAEDDAQGRGENFVFRLELSASNSA